jgi:hypothetical protein
MKNVLISFLLMIFVVAAVSAQTDDAAITAQIPTVVRFGGVLRESDGSASQGVHGITFAIYKQKIGGTAEWSETRNVTLDSEGRFSVLLGLEHPSGIPAEIFQNGESRWVGMTPEDGVERQRIFLATVPYAFTAANSQRLGGRAASEFVTQEQLQSDHELRADSASSNLRHRIFPPPIVGVTASVFQEPVFESTASSGPSFVSDATSGPVFQLHSSELNPNLNADLLHGLDDSAFAKVRTSNLFSEPQTFAGGVFAPAVKPEPGGQLIDSAGLTLSASAPDVQSGVSTKRNFTFNAMPIVGQSNVPSARLALSYALGDAAPSETGLWINSDGTLNFAPNQQLPSSAVIAALGGTENSGQNGSGTGTSTNNPQIDTVNYSFNQAETSTSAPVKVGNNEITLSPCPAGVNGTDLWHYLYISGSGTPEVVLVTGGTCTSQAKSGTIQFSAQYDHPAPYTVSSATDGVQEAVIDASTPGSFHESRIVTISPGTHLFRARLSIRTSNLVLSSSGAVIVCSMSDTCVMLGDPANANPISKITVDGLRFSAGVPNGTWPALEDNANGSTMRNIAPARTSIQAGTFGSLIQVDNDQAATIDNLDTVVGPWARCDQQFCSTAVVGPGPFSKNAGVIWIENSNFGLMCKANGVDNQNGNTLRISKTVIEGYAQFAVRSRTTYATANVTLEGVYTEVGGCVNPLGTGQGGLIVQNGSASISGTVGPQSQLPRFSTSGTTRYYYYVAVNSSTYGRSIPYLAGYADTDGATPFKVVWNQIGKSGVITYDVLRITGDGGAYMSAPSGPGSYAIAVGVAAATNCSNMACSIIDNP